MAREPVKQLRGLTSAQVADRVAAGAVNVVPEGPSRTTREIIRANIVTRFNILLTALLVVILVAVREPADALFGIVMVTNAAIGIIQELRAKATLDRLSVLTTPLVAVIRDGRTVEIAAPHIVMDDIVEVRAGDQLPVDGTVIESEALEIDESLLTGESDPVLKDTGDACLSGSFVVAGAGRFVVTRVGEKAYAAALAKEAKKFTLVRSELRNGIDWILTGVTWAVGPVIVVLVWSSIRADREFQEALSSAVAGAVGMVPQGLVLLTSIAYAVGVIRLGRQQVLVQELPAIEGLARIDTVCFDKTGTLTEGSLIVQDVVTLDDSDPGEALAALGAAEAAPNATLQAIIERFPSSSWSAQAAVPFSSVRKWSAATFSGRGTWVLGAPEIVVPDSAEVISTANSHAALGRRVIVLAETELALQADGLPRRLEPRALVILGDRIRPDASETVRYFARQGVATKVISGDHPATVGAIAREVGVPGAHTVVDGRHLPEDLDELARVVEENTVFGRVSPYQKRSMVAALQSRGHVVAMTGDGVNDVLALKESDIGIAIGTGSAAARSVAQLVLIDGSFATLPGVVAEGRRVISNIERVANLFVTKNGVRHLHRSRSRSRGAAISVPPPPPDTRRVGDNRDSGFLPGAGAFGRPRPQRFHHARASVLRSDGARRRTGDLRGVRIGDRRSARADPSANNCDARARRPWPVRARHRGPTAGAMEKSLAVVDGRVHIRAFPFGHLSGFLPTRSTEDGRAHGGDRDYRRHRCRDDRNVARRRLDQTCP